MVFGLFSRNPKDEHVDYNIGGQKISFDVLHVKGKRSSDTQNHTQCQITLPKETDLENDPYVFLLRECRERLREALGHDMEYNSTERVLSHSYETKTQYAPIAAVKGTLEAIAKDYPTLTALKQASAAEKAASNSNQNFSTEDTEYEIAGWPVTLSLGRERSSGHVHGISISTSTRTLHGRILKDILRERLHAASIGIVRLQEGQNATIMATLVRNDPALAQRQATAFEQVIQQCAQDTTIAQQVHLRKTASAEARSGNETAMQEKEIERKAGPYIHEAQAQIIAYCAQHLGEPIGTEHSTALTQAIEQGLREVAIQQTQR